MSVSDFQLGLDIEGRIRSPLAELCDRLEAGERANAERIMLSITDMLLPLRGATYLVAPPSLRFTDNRSLLCKLQSMD